MLKSSYGTTLLKAAADFELVRRKLVQKPRTWLVTGCAGFIGSHILECLLLLKQRVVGLDNFSTGSRQNLILVRRSVGPKAWKRFQMIRGDVTRVRDCYKALNEGTNWPEHRKKGNRKSKINIILHQAGLGSVPRSMGNPLSTHATNATGMLNLLSAAKDFGVRRFVYATSSSTYGDSPLLPKKEEIIGELLSPYAVSKYVTELYSKVFGIHFMMETFGLRYFNVFGPRQDPAGAYAAVIPRWIGEMLVGKENRIYGDGLTSRDFTFVDNVVQANLLAATTQRRDAVNRVYNIACGQATSLRKLHTMIRASIRKQFIYRNFGSSVKVKHQSNNAINLRYSLLKTAKPAYLPERMGDVRHSLASIAKAKRLLGYQPTEKIAAGIKKTVLWYLAQNR